MIWNFAFNIIVNSFITFLTVALLTKLLISIFRIQDSRFKVFLLALPIYKFIVDLFLYDLSTWAMFHNWNPLIAERGTRVFSASYKFIPITLATITFYVEDKLFTIADLIICTSNITIIQIVTISIFSTSLFLLMKKFFQNRRDSKFTLELISRAHKGPKGILVTEEITVPCAAYNKVLIPKKLLTILEPGELDAVIAHERAHLKYKDLFLCKSIDYITTLFWWIPTRIWTNILYTTLEKACDRNAIESGVSNHQVASSLIKASRFCKRNDAVFAMSFIKRKSLNTRVKSLLKYKQRNKGFILIKAILIIPMLSSLFFGKLWIF